MKKTLLISTTILSLSANNDYIPISKISKDKQAEYKFSKLNNNTVVNKKEVTQKIIIEDNEEYTRVSKLKDETFFNNKNTKIKLSLSDFNSKSEQYIYNGPNDRKISQLTWEANNVKLLGFGIEHKTKDLGLYFNYKTNIKDGNGVMDDYDWLYDSQPNTWTDWSHHDNTVVEDVNILDLGINKEFTIYDKTKLIMSLGYKWEKQLFKAYDGSYIYSGSDLPSELRAYTGTFSGKGITYEQVYKGFYLGAELEKKYKDLYFMLNTKYTPNMQVEFTDTHHMRVPSFTDYTSFNDTSMLSLGLGIDYNMDRNQILSFSYDYTKYFYKRGDRVRSYVTGYNWELPGTVGVESENNLINLEYKYRFFL